MSCLVKLHGIEAGAESGVLLVSEAIEDEHSVSVGSKLFLCHLLVPSSLDEAVYLVLHGSDELFSSVDLALCIHVDQYIVYAGQSLCTCLPDCNVVLSGEDLSLPGDDLICDACCLAGSTRDCVIIRKFCFVR